MVNGLFGFFIQLVESYFLKIILFINLDPQRGQHKILGPNSFIKISCLLSGFTNENFEPVSF